MSRRWVVNASPLILLGKIGRESLLVQLTDQLVIPEAVADEVARRSGGFQVIEGLTRSQGVAIAVRVAIPEEVRSWDLGPGESQVLALAAAESVDRCVVDDLAARRCAGSLGLSVIGTLGVVLRAKRRGLISEGRPIVAELQAVGLYVSEVLVEQVLSHLGE